MTFAAARTRFAEVQVTSARLLPLLVSLRDPSVADQQVLDEFNDGIAVAYAFGPPYGERLVTWSDLRRMNVSRRNLRRAALRHLDGELASVRIHGQPPALMLSFYGLESSVLLVDDFWDDIQRSVPGDLVVGVPARDVVIFTGSESRPGLERARRAVDRVFFAGDQHLLSRDLLVWRGGWVPFGAVGPRLPHPRPPWEPPATQPRRTGAQVGPPPGYRWPEEPIAEEWAPPGRRTRRPNGPRR